MREQGETAPLVDQAIPRMIGWVMLLGGVGMPGAVRAEASDKTDIVIFARHLPAAADQGEKARQV